MMKESSIGRIRKHMNIFKHLRTQLEEIGNTSSEVLLEKLEPHYSTFTNQQTDNIGAVVTRHNQTRRETPMNTARHTVSS